MNYFRGLGQLKDNEGMKEKVNEKENRKVVLNQEETDRLLEHKKTFTANSKRHRKYETCITCYFIM